ERGAARQWRRRAVRAPCGAYSEACADPEKLTREAHAPRKTVNACFTRTAACQTGRWGGAQAQKKPRQDASRAFEDPSCGHSRSLPQIPLRARLRRSHPGATSQTPYGSAGGVPQSKPRVICALIGSAASAVTLVDSVRISSACDCKALIWLRQ